MQIRSTKIGRDSRIEADSMDVSDSKLAKVHIKSKTLLLRRCEIKGADVNVQDLNLQFVHIEDTCNLSGAYIHLIGSNPRKKGGWVRLRYFRDCHLQNVSLDWSNTKEPHYTRHTIQGIHWWGDIP